MAGNKMNPKTKGKEDKSKTSNKNIGQNNEDVEEPDFALLRKPIPTSITGFAQVRKIFDMATAELKDLLSKECDLLYECKVCRNLFRSLANFISHKRVYCKEKFNSTVHSHFVKSASMVNEILKIKRLEQGYQESLKESSNLENKDEFDVDERIPLSKDLTTIIEKIANNKGSYENNCNEPQVALQKIPNSSVAVFQNIETQTQVDEMRVQVKELDNILSRDTAVMQSDGNFTIKSSGGDEPDNVIQISDDEDNDGTNILKCKICDMQFSTQKTLKFHMKYKHVESRLVYPCPDCLEIFSTSWSVYRHLFKVHRKTAAQIRRLRESIQAKAFKMNNPPAFYERRKNNMKASSIAQKITEEERLDQENQAWMDNMEGDGELPRCGGCGRTFERRAALAAHTHTCQPRSRALARRPQETKKIEIQIRKDYNKGPPVNLNIPLKTTENNENKPPKEDSLSTNKPNKEEQTTEQKEPVEQEKEVEEAPMDVSEDDKSNDATESPEAIRPHIEVPKLTVRLPFAHQTEKSNQVAFRQKILPDIEIAKMSCKRCDNQFKEIQELYDHMAEHIKWMRYACKLCNFKSYTFEKLPEHVKVVHKLKGDKDFYFSTVKALDGTEALELCEPLEEIADTSETSPDSGRPSRCSSDSSRLSDDSSSSSTRIEGSRKRKIYHNKGKPKKRKDVATKAGEDSKDDDVSLDKNVTVESYTSSTLMKSFEENSSDMDDVVDNITKKQSNDTSVASRRPVRRKTKPKNEDFEYDLSNLLKMEAQGYRDALVMQANAKSNQSKKKIQQDIQINYDSLNKDCCGALMALTKKSVERASAHVRTSSSSFYSKEIRSQNIFLRPMVPRTLSKGDKVSPKKDINEDGKECSSPIKELTINKVVVNVPVKNNDAQVKNDVSKNNTPPESSDPSPQTDNSTEIPKPTTPETNTESNPPKDQNTVKPVIEIKKPISIPPIKFRRQSLDVIKNPLINKNISDFTKAGMKTKILVIKPINRNKDGSQTVKTPLKFQTIKLKDPNKSSSNEDKVSDQVVVVKVPKVECTIARPATSDISNSERPPSKDIPAVAVPSDKDNTETAIESNGIKSIEPVQSEPSDEQKSSDSIEFIDENILEESSKFEGATKNDSVASSNSTETIKTDNAKVHDV